MHCFFKKCFFICCIILLAAACHRQTEANIQFLTKVETTFENDMTQSLPDFSSPAVIDPDCIVPDMPEDVVWITSKPKDLGSPDTKTGGIFRTAISYYPVTFRSMGIDANTSARDIVWTTLELLGINSETQEFMPQSATHWAFGADGKTVYFKLHEGMMWSDGVPCTADDFLFAIEFMRSPFLEDPWYNGFAHSIEVTKINDYCIGVKLLIDEKLPQSLLLSSVNFSPHPKHFYNGEITENWAVEYDQRPEPTTGPYAVNMAESIPGELLVLDRVQDWWARSYEYLQRTANVARIEYYVTENAEKLFYEGKLDSYTFANIDEWNSAELQTPIKNGYINRYMFNYLPVVGLKGIFLNTRSKLLSNKNIRKALYYALDMQGMIDTVLDGQYLRYHNIGIGQAWDDQSFNDENIKKPAFNPRHAGTILAAEGFRYADSDGILKNEAGQRVSFELLFGQRDYAPLLVYLREKAKEAGIEIKLKLDYNYWSRIFSLSYDACIEEFSTGFLPDYSQYFSKESSETPGSNNICGYWSPEMEHLLAGAYIAKTVEELIEVNKKIERLVDDEALVIPSFISNTERIGAWRWLRYPAWGNHRTIGTDFDPYGYLWIDDKIRLEMLTAAQQQVVLPAHIYTPSKRYIAK